MIREGIEKHLGTGIDFAGTERPGGGLNFDRFASRAGQPESMRLWGSRFWARVRRPFKRDYSRTPTIAQDSGDLVEFPSESFDGRDDA